MTGGDWRLRAACRGAPLLAPFSEKNSADERDFINRYCKLPCPVRGECLAFALKVEATMSPAVERYGVFGGFTGQQRRGMARRGVRQCTVCQRPFVPSNKVHSRCRPCGRSGITYVAGPVREHGVHSGYMQHLRRGEEPCGPCRDAKRVYDRGRRTAGGAA